MLWAAHVRTGHQTLHPPVLAACMLEASDPCALICTKGRAAVTDPLDSWMLEVAQALG